SQHHHIAAVRYDALRKRLEHLLNYPPKKEKDLKKIIRQIETDYDKLRSDSPNTPDLIWKKVKKQYEDDDFIEKLTKLLEKRYATRDHK
ncbi:MAG: hypothetical protein MI922_18910, partial [Bacteroidales bacterium]|nr:hypothetical protein [Bacteroidales bacterium]